MQTVRFKTCNVINDELILTHSEMEEDFQPKAQDKFAKIEKLTLSYKSILRIRSLDGLHRLRILRLDNNFIECIENLDFLCNLRWLDLSFNCICKIEGLKKLTLLTDLSLFSNVIETVSDENFVGLTHLTTLSLGNNKLHDAQGVVRALRPLPALQILTLAGNRLNADEYRSQVIFGLRGLKYLDYALIDESARAFAEEYKFQNEAAAVADARENEEDTHGKASDDIHARLVAYQLIGYDQALLHENKDLEVLLSLNSAFDESRQKLFENVRAITETIKKHLQSALLAKENVLASFVAAVDKMAAESEGESKAQIEEYERARKMSVREIFEKNHSGPFAVLSEMETRVEALEQSLIARQLGLKSLLKKSLSKLENTLKGVFGEIEKAVLGETGLRRMEDVFAEFIAKLQEEALAAAEQYEKFTENRLLDSASDIDNFNAESNEASPWNEAQASLLESKDELRAIITNNIKESLEAKQKSTENFIRAEISNERMNLVKTISEAQKETARKTINNVIEYVEKQRTFWKNKKRI